MKTGSITLTVVVNYKYQTGPLFGDSGIDCDLEVDMKSGTMPVHMKGLVDESFSNDQTFDELVTLVEGDIDNA